MSKIIISRYKLPSKIKYCKVSSAKKQCVDSLFILCRKKTTKLLTIYRNTKLWLHYMMWNLIFVVSN